MKPTLRLLFGIPRSALTAFGTALLVAFSLFGSAPPTPAQTDWGTALSFDGADDYVRSQQEIDLANKSFSIEAWAQRRSSDTMDFIIAEGGWGSSRLLHFGFHSIAGNQFVLGFYDNDLWSTNSYTDNAWHHWAGTYDASTRTRCLYRDGALIASDTAPEHYQGTGPLYVGVTTLGGDEFDGRIDEVRIWNVVRSAADIQANMDQRLTGTEPGLVAYWKFDENTGTNVVNGASSGSAYDGTLMNGPIRVVSTVPRVLDFNDAPLGVLTSLEEDSFVLTWVGFGDNPTVAESGGPHGRVLKDSVINGYGAEVIIQRSNGWAFSFQALDASGMAVGSDAINVTMGGEQQRIMPAAATFATYLSAAPDRLITALRVNIVSVLTDLAVDNIRLWPAGSPAAPTVVTTPATLVTTAGATLNATVGIGNLPTIVWFEWGTTTNYGSSSLPLDLSSGNEPVAVSQEITGLTPATVYHFRAVATNNAGTIYGLDESFLIPSAPLVFTAPASPVTTSNATLNGVINPGGLPTIAWFEWGTTIDYGQTSMSADVGSTNVLVPVSFSLTGLTPGATYHFRAAASNSLGVVYGADTSFGAWLNAMILGAIPDQTVWHGSTNEFLLRWTENGPVFFNIDAYPPPSGTLSLLPYWGSDWLFRYVPAPADKTPFTVTITAGVGGQTISQSFLITPEPILPPEQRVFGTEAHTQPLAVTTYGMTISDRESLLPESLNYQNSKVRSIRIIGETVEIEEGHTNQLYDTYFSTNNARRDIKEMEIIAERLIIRSPVRLKQTEVTIYARELRFEGAGQIKTTPEEIMISPGFDSKGGRNGANGLNAGNVTLHVGTLSSETPGMKFDLTGGAGQQGGPGQDGVAGFSPPGAPCWSSYTLCDSGSCDTFTAPSGACIIYWYYTIAGVQFDSGGVNAWPGNGGDALPSGKPGQGGRGGELSSSQDLSGLFSLAGGASGQPARAGSWYWGGAAGQPRRSVMVHFYWHVFYGMESEQAGTTHQTVDGTNAPVRQPDSPVGPAGSSSFAGSTNTWLHPLLLRKVLAHGKDDYLGSRIGEADTRLKQYAAAIDAYRADTNHWAALNPLARFELEQMGNEIQILRQRIASGFDYFGNPAGWVPMLSFEVNTALFDREIDQAIDLLYLAYWINHKATNEQRKVDALSAARNKLRAEMAQAQSDYSNAVTQLPVLKNKALNQQNRILEAQTELHTKEQELLQQAAPAPWLVGIRWGLKASALILEMTPAIEAFGFGIDVSGLSDPIRRLSDLDPDNPWATIVGEDDISTTYLNSAFEAASTSQQDRVSTLDPDWVESEKLAYLDGLLPGSAGLSAGLRDVSGYLNSNQAPSAEISAELERIRSEYPEIRTLIEKVEGLVAEKRKFVDELITTMQTVATLSDLITRNILTIDAMNQDITPGLTVLDERAASYLEEMERRAYDRLLKYHYYLAKAYEYRLLRPYTAPLNLEGLVAKFREIADLNTNQSITVDQFRTFKTVFRAPLSELATNIFDEYNSSPPELSVPIRFSLTTNEIARLNHNETITLNFMNEGWFFPDEENIRIVDLRIFSMATEPVGGPYGSPAYVDVNIAHSGISNLKSDGAIYQFRHYNRQTENPIVWGGRYDPVDNRIDPIRPSAATDSLLRSLLSGHGDPEMLIYSRPSAWADLRISRRVFDASGRGINITSLRLEMQYDFSRRSDLLSLRDLKVLVMTALPAGGGGSVLEQSTLTPYFIVNTGDCNGRQDARGQFLRTYPQGEPVRVTAQQEYGPLWFSKWIDEFGNDLPGGPHTSPAIDVVMQNDLILCAQYVPLSSVPRVLGPPVFSGAGDAFTLSWNGCGKLTLQATPSLTPPIIWHDVPGSESRSFIELPTTNSTMFFRLVLP